VVFEDEGGQLAGKGPIAKFIPAPVQAAIAEKAGLKAGDAVFFSAGNEDKAAALAGKARVRIGDELALSDKDQFAFAWITDFPMYEWNEDEKKLDFSHNPFSAPNMEHGAFMALDPADKDAVLAIKALQYDMVCNGYELASGSVRNHRPDRMVKAFEIAGYGEKEVLERFGGMYRAFQYGAPPHGGMAAGVDRIVMLLCGAVNLREVTLFPMNQRAEDLLLGAPSEVTPKQLRELHIRLNLPEK
jgi:aspartyl-tRNA synthetase